MQHLEIATGLGNSEEHAGILLTAVKGRAVEQSIIGLHEATRGVVAVQEPAAALGECKELGELPRSRQFENCAALGIRDALVGNLRRAIEVPIRGLNDEIGPASLWARVTTDATRTGESE